MYYIRLQVTAMDNGGLHFLYGVSMVSQWYPNGVSIVPKSVSWYCNRWHHNICHFFHGNILLQSLLFKHKTLHVHLKMSDSKSVVMMSLLLCYSHLLSIFNPIFC